MELGVRARVWEKISISKIVKSSPDVTLPGKIALFLNSPLNYNRPLPRNLIPFVYDPYANPSS